MCNHHRRFVLLVLLCLALLGGCARRQPAEQTSLPQIVIGSDNYPPFNYEDANGERIGIDVDLANEAFRRMGYEPVFVLINWEDKENLVNGGQLDCIWGSFSINGREADYRWAGPYMVSYQAVAVRPESDITTLADLAGKRVAVQSTTKPEELFLNHSDPRIPQVAEVFSLQNRELIYPFLSKGYADAIAAHKTAILQYMKDYNVQYRILDETLLTVGLGVAFSNRDQRGVAEKLTQTFEEMRLDGTIAKIIGNYLEQPEKYLEVDLYERK